MSSSQGTSPSHASTSAHLASNKPRRVLACKLCQHRKIKCDRNFPCETCRKAQVECVESKPAPPRKRRRPNEELREKLNKLEALLNHAYAGGMKREPSAAAESPASSFTIPSRSSTVNTAPSQEQVDQTMTGGSAKRDATDANQQLDKEYQTLKKHGRLVKEDGGTRFMDSPIMGTIYDELREMREIINADDDDEDASDSVTPDDNSELLFPADTPSSTNPEGLWPAAEHIFQLWRVYLERVNPLTKIIHVPTLGQYVLQGCTGCSTLPNNVEALLFSIWLMAAVAMTPEECQDTLGYSRDVALHRFSSGVRMALVRLNFLKTHDLTALQALVIYLISLQGRYNRHAAWILNGIVIRMALKMGLHRDGEVLKLGPFESEMRRRLWWQIMMLDAKYAMMTGINHGGLPQVWDTKEPKNLNDVDIHPGSTGPFQDQDGPTEMIFVMISNKIAKFLVETPSLEPLLMLSEWSDVSSHANPLLNEFRQKIARLGQDLVGMLNKYCDYSAQAPPVHKMAVAVQAQIINKLHALATAAKEQPEWGSEIMDSKDNAFKLSICAMEHEEENCVASQDKGFLWHALLHFQLDVFMYLAGQLSHRLEGGLVDRAWKQVDVVYRFHPELFDTSKKTHDMLARFILRAWSKRREVLRHRTGHVPETPSYISRLQSTMPQGEDLKPEPTPPVLAGQSFMTPSQLDVLNPFFDPVGADALFAFSTMDFDSMSNSLPGEPSVDGQNNGLPSSLMAWQYQM